MPDATLSGLLFGPKGSGHRKGVCLRTVGLEPGAQGDGSALTRGGGPGRKGLVLDMQVMEWLPGNPGQGGKCHPEQ